VFGLMKLFGILKRVPIAAVLICLSVTGCTPRPAIPVFGVQMGSIYVEIKDDQSITLAFRQAPSGDSCENLAPAALVFSGKLPVRESRIKEFLSTLGIGISALLRGIFAY
jgi:hypothetical protein